MIRYPELPPPPEGGYLEPCLCGSGQSYMDCHWSRSLLWESPVPLSFPEEGVPDAARRAAVWQVGWIPAPQAGLNHQIQSCFLIVASGQVIWSSADFGYPMSFDSRASETAERIARAAYEYGAEPAVVWTRNARFAEHLQRYLQPWDISAAHVTDLDDFDACGRSFLQHLIEDARGPYTIGARTWAAWKQPNPWDEEMLQVLPNLKRQDFCETMNDALRILICEEGKPDWYMYGMLGERDVMVLLEYPEDLPRILLAPDPHVPGLKGLAIDVSFRDPAGFSEPDPPEPHASLLEPFREIGVPWLTVQNTPACILTIEEGARLLRTLQSLDRVWPQLLYRTDAEDGGAANDGALHEGAVPAGAPHEGAVLDEATGIRFAWD